MSSELLDCTFSPRVVSRRTDRAGLSRSVRLTDSAKCPTVLAVDFRISGRRLPGSIGASEARRMKRSRKLVHCIAVTSDIDTPLWDVVGLGQAMVDISASVEDDSLILNAGVDKGARR